MKKEIVLASILAIVLIFGAAYFAKSPSKVANTSSVNKQENMNNEAVNFKNLSAQDFKNLWEENKNNTNFVLLDVRTKDEFDAGHIDGAIQLDFYSPIFAQKLNELDKNKNYLIYCRSGNRSGQTLQLMKQLGFKNVYNLQYGIKSWAQAGFDLVK